MKRYDIIALILVIYLAVMAYFGKGPQENYSDRSCGAFIGLYRGTPGDFMHDYITPQENGNRCAVRWLTLTEGNGRGIQIAGDSPLSMSVWDCTQEALDRARHVTEVERLDGQHRLRAGRGRGNRYLEPECAPLGAVPPAGKTLCL